MTRVGDEFFETAIHRTPDKEQRISARVDLVYGAGKADDVYLSWRDDGRLYELPMAWLYPLKKWGASPVDPSGVGGFSRPLNPRCLECHNTWFKHVPGTANQYKREDHILGVTCESCHGPGREHVSFHEKHPEAESAHSVVHPARLPRDRQTDLCTQCHSNAIKHRGPAFSYRPGESLEDYYRTVVTRHTEDDHVANQIHHLRQSKCFQESDSLTCITCHDPHRPKSSPKSDSIQDSCHKCHQPANCTDQDHLPTPVRSNCVGCHMPQYIKINVNFDLEDDLYVPPIRRYEHRIAIHPAAKKDVLLSWYRMQPDAGSREATKNLTESLIEYWLAEAENCRRAYRFMGAIAAIREALRLDTSEDTRDNLRRTLHEIVAIQSQIDDSWNDAVHQITGNRSAEAIETLNRILALKPDDAKAHARLGTLYAMSGKRELAIEHLQAVSTYDSENPSGHAMLGWLAYLDGRSMQALDHYRIADEVEPYNAKINFQMGLVLTRLKLSEEAEERFRRTLAIDPKNIESCRSLSLALRAKGLSDEALPYAQRTAKLSESRNLDDLLELAETYTETKRHADAARTITLALEVARKENPTRAPHIQKLLVIYRARANETKK